MAYKIITKKRFENKVAKLLEYLYDEWGETFAYNFNQTLNESITLLSYQPAIGAQINALKNIRSILITKHNRVYYRIEENKIIIINMIDTRKNPKKNPFNTTT